MIIEVKKFASLFIGLIVLSLLGLSCSKEESINTKNGKFIDFASRMAASGMTAGQVISADKQMRVQVISDLHQAMTNQYSLLKLKENRIKDPSGQPFDSEAYLTHCSDVEAATEDTSDLHFMDRIRQ